MTISRPAAAGSDLVAAWSEPLLAGALLQVGDGDSAVAVQDGQVLGVYGPGQFNLPAQVAPAVRIYFVLTRPIGEIKFGGRLPGLPPVPGAPPPRSVFGDFSLRVINPSALLGQLLGFGNPDSEALLAWARQQMLTAVVDAMTEMASAGTNPSDPGNLDSLQQAVAARTANWESYGLQLAGIGAFKAK